MRIFLLCKVRGCPPEEVERQRAYVESLESQGHTVHWPPRDTKQDDPLGGVGICRATLSAIMGSNEVHVMWDVTSEGRLFDLGMVFALRELYELGRKFSLATTTSRSFKVVLADSQALDAIIVEQERNGVRKSYERVLRDLVERSAKE